MIDPPGWAARSLGSEVPPLPIKERIPEQMSTAGVRVRRVLIVVQNLPVPFDRRVWLEATTLQRAGYQVSVVSPKLKGWNLSFEVIEDVHIYRYPLPIEAHGTLGYLAEFIWCFICTAFISLRVSLSGRGFDVIHACNPPDTYWLLGLGWRLVGKRFVFDHHDLAPEVYSDKFGKSSGLIRRILELLERCSLKAADVVIATNESHRQVAMERGGVVPERIYIVRSGPDLDRFRVFPPDPAWRQGKDYLIVYLGEIGSQDGVENLIQAARILRDDLGRSDFHCVLVGGGPHLDTVRAFARAQGVMGVCTFTGDVSDDAKLCRILSSADIAVVPDARTPHSDRSTMNKVVEYMFFGLPMVAFDLRENRFSAADAAVYAGDNTPRSMAECIADLLQDPARRQKMANVGRARVRDRLAWQHSVSYLLAAYNKAFEQR